MGEITPEQTIAIKLTLYVVSLTAVAIRAYIRWWLACRLTATDIAIFIAMVLYTGEEIIGILLWKSQFFSMPAEDLTVGGLPSLEGSEENPGRVSRQLALLWSSTFFTFTIFWVIKVAFLLLYYQLFPQFLVGLRRCLHATSVIVILTYIFFLYTNVFSCGVHLSRNWSTNPKEFCYSFASYTAFVYLLTTHLITDVIIYILPFFLLKHLALPRNQLYGVAAMFALGILCVMCTLARSVTVSASHVFPMRKLMVWDSAETTLAIVVGCGPCFKWLWLRAKNYPRGLAIREYGHGGRVHEETIKSVRENVMAGGRQRKGSRAGVVVLGDVDVEGDGDTMGGWVERDDELSVDERRRLHELALLQRAKQDAFEIRSASVSSEHTDLCKSSSHAAKPSSSQGQAVAPWEDVTLPQLAHYKFGP